ncbi:MAG: RNA-binding protein [Alphaproteobacteria bacterium]|nr:RNA-binding protein [Alphaproteobacteria bacterium]
MPKSPKGEKRPADVIGNAIHVMGIATGEIEEKTSDDGKEYARKGGLKGGQRRAQSLTPEQRREIARKGAIARWGKRESEDLKN